MRTLFFKAPPLRLITQILPALTLLFMIAPCNFAQAQSEEERPAGHSAHGEAFNEGPRQQAYLMGDVGAVHFPVTTRDPAAQSFFDQGVGQLHGFWYFEAERSFRQVLAIDPTCAMAYWGMAMANTNNDDRARAFIAQAVERKSKISRREAMWIDVLAAFYDKKAEKSSQKRRRNYVRALEAIVHEFPDEMEARALIAMQIWRNDHRGPSISSHEAVDALIREVLAVEPMHPVHHYRIHLWDNEKPERALAAAALCGPSAPRIAHMWHMPGHIYSKLHRYTDAVWQQEASARVDHAHMIRDRVTPDQIHNYAHNNEWLIRNLSHVGRVRDAVALAKNMIELPRHPDYNTLKRDGSSAKYGRERLMEVLERYELWDEVIALVETPYLEPTKVTKEQRKRLRLLGVAHFRQHDLVAGGQIMEEIKRRLAKIRACQHAAGDEAEKKARSGGATEEDVAKARALAETAHTGDLGPWDEVLSELRGERAATVGRWKAALRMFRQVDGFPKERLVRVCVHHDADRARRIANREVAKRPGEVHPLANQVDVLWRIGKKDKAAAAFANLRKISESIDLDSPIFARLAPVARELGFPEDWRQPRVSPDDLGSRPPLESLGPLRWSPPPAPAWELTTPDGRPLGLAQYEGRPVLVVFYLGFGCLHCVEQLRSLAPRVGDFAKAGVEIVAISSETSEQLQTALADYEGGLPFPIANDSALEVFRAYRAYDDFEETPLHGVFLIDGAGLVRWQDIGYEPFDDVDFLLQESKRLLRLPVDSPSPAKAATRTVQRPAP